MGHGTSRWFDTDVTAAPQKATLAAGLSLGIFLFGLESDRLPTLAHVQGYSSMPVLTSLISLAILGVCVALLCRRPPRHPAPMALPVLFALACSLGLAGMYHPAGSLLPESLQAVRRVLYAVSSPALVYFWAQRAMPLGRPFVIRSFGAGVIVVGCLGVLTMAFEHVIAMGLVVALPFVGVALLPMVNTAEASVADEAQPGCAEDSPWSVLRAVAGNPAAGDSVRNTARGAAIARAIVLLLLKLVPFLCYAVIFGNVHFSWVAVQDGGAVSMWVQLGASTGSIICGSAALALTRLHWGRALESIMNLLLVAFALVALWLSTILTSGHVFAYLVLLNIAQKLTFLLMLLLGFSYARNGRECASLWTLVYYSFFLGTCISHVSSTQYAMDALNIMASVALAVVFVADITDVIMLYGGVSSRAIATSGANGAFGSPATTQAAPGGRTGAVPNGQAVVVPVDQPSDVDTPARSIAGSGANTSFATSAGGHRTTGKGLAFARSAETGASRGSTRDADRHPAAGPEHSGPDGLAYTCHLIASQHDLTRREEEILQLLARGRTAARIAETLCITVATARTHQRNIYDKLGVHSQQDILDMFDERAEDGADSPGAGNHQ